MIRGQRNDWNTSDLPVQVSHLILVPSSDPMSPSDDKEEPSTPLVEPTSPDVLPDELPSPDFEIPAPAPMAPMVPMTKVELSLMETLTHLNIRSEIQECMNSMLLDVETTYYLQHNLELEANRHTVNQLTKQHKATILEADAERRARESIQVELADGMVQELMAMSGELESLLNWKKEHEHKVESYDELLAKLAQTQEELQEAQRIQYSGEPKPRKVESTEQQMTSEVEITFETETSGESPLPTQETEMERKAEDEKPSATSTMEPSDSMEELKPAPKAPPTAAVDAIIPGEAEDSQAAQSTETTEEKSPDDADQEVVEAAVTLDEEEEEEEVPSLLNIDLELLMTLFGFLDAVDILNTAQINLIMYTKVDSIFSISDDGYAPPEPTPPPAPAPAPVAVRPPAPAPAAPAAATPRASSPATQSETAAPSGFFSMLQPAKPASGNKKQGGMNASVAQSMASKLSDGELAAILSMTDKLNRMEKEVSILRNEKEALAAKLDGTESVKQFLISKVRDVEVKLTQSREDEIKVTQQIASDQEVIAFLDSRVQELERQTETLTKDKSRSQSELDAIKAQTSKKITMLSDMLKYEREKLKEEEGDWKATKKVLVKEVKSCRAQILALQAERDGFKEQNEMLKRAIVSTGRTPASPKR